MPKVLADVVELTDSTGFQRRYTVADGTQISKGVLLTLSDPRTAAAVTASGANMLAGIAAIEKEASDGATTISAWTDGIFDILASGAIGIGDPITFIVDGYIARVVNNPTIASGATVAGYALETASDNERINVRVRL